jgi:hypothetical protein
MKVGLVPKKRYSVSSVNPNDTKIATFCNNQHLQCITLNVMAATSTTARGAVVIDNALVIRQLTNAISLQNKEAMESNILPHQEIDWQIKQEEKKKDRTKTLHPTIVNMIKQATATDWNDKDKEIAPTCLHFINSDKINLAQYKLIHQFKESRFPNVTFASGMTQALYLGDFLYANSSSPSNFTVFTFREQEPNSFNQQKDYLICHLI